MKDLENEIKILKGNIVFTKNSEKFNILEDGYIIVKGKYIQGVYEVLPEQYKNIKIEDYKDKLIIPGLIDLHTHASQFNMKGIGYDKELIPWLEEYIFPEETKFKDISYAEKVYKEFVNELYNEGTTRTVIFATVHNEATDILMNLIEERGLCAFVGKVNMDRNCPESLREESDDSIIKTIKWMENCSGKYKLVKPIITPRFVPSCTSELMNKLGFVAVNENIPVQSHLSENLSEIQWVKELHPDKKNYSEVYNGFNLFGQTKTIMAHCVHLTEEEIELMIKNEVMIAHCPTSNTNLSSGISPINKLLKRKIQIGLGSDIAAGESLSMFSVMAEAIKVSKLRSVCLQENEKPLTLQEVFYLATKGGGKFFGKVGSFEKDYEFDALIIDDEDLWKLNKGNIEERIERLIYLGGSGNIAERYVCGRKI